MNVSNSAFNFLQTFIKISFEIDSKATLLEKIVLFLKFYSLP